MSLTRHRHEAMATQWELIIPCDDADPADELHLNAVAQEIFRDIDQLERELSRFSSSSDIARINQAAAGESVRVGAACMDCLTFGRAVWEATGGAFDVTIGPLYRILRSEDGSLRRPSAKELATAKARCGFDKLALDPDAMTVTPAVSGMSLDLGAIGKGYALDQAAFTLKEWNIPAALLDAGNSTVLAIGDMPGKSGWLLRAGHDEPLTLKNQALSGTGFLYKGHHIIDPRSATAVNVDDLHRWAIAPNATLADALSTAFMVMSRAEIEAFLAKEPEVRVIFADDAPE